MRESPVASLVSLLFLNPEMVLTGIRTLLYTVYQSSKPAEILGPRYTLLAFIAEMGVPISKAIKR